MKKLSYTIGVVLLLDSFLMLWAKPYVILNSGEKKVGEEIRVDSKGNVILRTKLGPLTFPSQKVRKAVADKPPQFDALRRAVQAGKYEPTIEPLKKIMVEYKQLSWDEKAASLLATAQMGTGNATEALETIETLLALNPDAEEELNLIYWEALIENEKFSVLFPKLDKTIEGGPRDEAARAQLMRGDINMKRQLYEEALLDYLRTVTLYKKQKELQPEALFKTATALENLKDARSKKFYRMLVEQYPESEFAGKAREKI